MMNPIKLKLCNETPATSRSNVLKWSSECRSLAYRKADIEMNTEPATRGRIPKTCPLHGTYVMVLSVLENGCSHSLGFVSQFMVGGLSSARTSDSESSTNNSDVLAQ